MIRRLLLTALVASAMALTASAQGLNGKTIYVNPGHGGWTTGDRPLPTINYQAMDTLGFFETKTNLWKCLELTRKLEQYGARVVMSRTKNGYMVKDNKNTSGRERIETYADENGQPQLIELEKIAAHVDSLQPDYFISVHSNAAPEGSTVNYLVLLYRGETGNDYVKGSIERAQVAYPYIWDNPLDIWSHATPEKPLIVGDLTFMGGTPPGTPNKLGYTGYLAVLKHSIPCFLAEGSFHTYHPERHRLLNRDYCRMEGVRYFRGINAFFKGAPEKVGYIMGALKDADEVMTHPLYKHKEGSGDQWRPINGAMVYLIDDKGRTVKAYHTDDNYNGIFAFFDLKPGNYTLRYEAYGYQSITEKVKVEADKTTHLKPMLHKTEQFTKGFISRELDERGR